MDHHLDGEAAEGRLNSRNGYGRKTVLTETGRLPISVPCDRLSTFDPQLIAKYRRRLGLVQVLPFQALPCRQLPPSALMVSLLPVKVGLGRFLEFVRRQASEQGLGRIDRRQASAFARRARTSFAFRLSENRNCRHLVPRLMA